MNKLTIKVCPVCGSAHIERAMTCIDHYASSEAFYLCRCQDCSFLFTQDFPVEAEIGRYYETPDYISHSDTKKGLMNRVYHWVRSYMLGRKARLVVREAHRKEGRLLDIGTGTGYFADAMQKRGWQVEAVERNAQARVFAKEHFNLDIKPDTALQDFAPGSFDVITLWHVMEHLEHLNETWDTLNKLLTEKGVLIIAVPNCSSYDAKKYGAHWAKEHFNLDIKPDTALQDFAPGSFDVITLWHVMEHLEHLNETWDTLNKLLTEKGVLIIAVPNCSSYDAKKYGAHWAAYDVPRHLWHFTPGTIQKLGAKHEFILAARYPMPFDAFYVSMLSEKYMGRSLSFFRGMLSGTLAWFSALGSKERSSSMIYVFRKKQK